MCTRTGYRPGDLEICVDISRAGRDTDITWAFVCTGSMPWKGEARARGGSSKWPDDDLFEDDAPPRKKKAEVVLSCWIPTAQ